MTFPRPTICAVSLGGALMLCILGGAPLASAEQPPEPQAEIVVSGDATLGRDPTAATTVIEGAPLREPSPTAAEVVERAPGVQVTRTGTVASLSTLSVRGSDASQVAVYFAGVRLVDELSGVSDLSRIPVWAVERVEVVRGTTPLDAPGRALAGAVFFEPRVTERPAALAGLSLGSYGARSAYALFSVASPPSSDRGQETRSLRVHTSISFRWDEGAGNFSYWDDGETAFDTSDDTRRVRQNADYQGYDMLGLSRIIGGSPARPFKVDILLGSLRRNQGVSSLSATPALHSRLTSTREIVGLVFDERLSKQFELKAKASFTRQRDDFFDPEGELGFGVPELGVSSIRGTGSLNLKHHAASGFSMGLSLHGELAKLGRYSALPGSGMADEGILSGRADAEWSKQRFTSLAFVEGLCAHASGALEGLEAQTERCAPEARLGASYELFTGLYLKANVGYGVRAPTLGERFGISATARGRPGLEFEKGPSGDVGITMQRRGPLGSVAVEFFAFARAAHDLIIFERSSLGYVRPDNIGSGRFLGLEGSLNTKLRYVNLELSLTAQDPRNTTANRATANTLLPFRSQLMSRGELELYLERKTASVVRVSSFLAFNYRSGRVLDPAGLLILPEQMTWDIGARYEFLGGRLGAQAQVQNLFDVPRYDVLGYPLPGRTVELGLELRL